MQISYTYTITEVDEVAGSMVITYTSPDFPTVVMGARTPRPNEPVVAVVAEYAPLYLWASTWRQNNPGETFTVTEAKPLADTYGEITAVLT